MSGGSWNHLHSQVNEAADRLIKENTSEHCNDLRVAFGKRLKDVAEVLKAIEYVDSHDCSYPHDENAIAVFLSEEAIATLSELLNRDQGTFSLDDLQELKKRWGTDKPAKPTPGQIYRHRNHDPDNCKWHEYEVICIVESGTGYQDSPAYFTAMNTDTLGTHDILPAAGSLTADPDDARNWAWPEVEERHVAYRNTKDNKVWLRPLIEFMDGRFALVSRD